jgi:hypothetical protein
MSPFTSGILATLIAGTIFLVVIVVFHKVLGVGAGISWLIGFVLSGVALLVFNSFEKRKD